MPRAAPGTATGTGGERSRPGPARSAPSLAVEDPPVILTAPAAARVGELWDAAADPRLALRVAVRPGGCSGYAWELFFDAERADDDVCYRVERPDGPPVPVVVDAVIAGLVAGTVVDHADGLTGGFRIHNPNARRTCGCGQSFS